MNRGAMGNKWKLITSSKPKHSNINKINQGFNPNQVLKTRPHLFNLTSSFFLDFFFGTVRICSNWKYFEILKIKARIRQYIYIKHGPNKTLSMAKNHIFQWNIPPHTYSQLITKTIPKLQNSLRVMGYHGFSLKACNELQNKERGTKLPKSFPNMHVN